MSQALRFLAYISVLLHLLAGAPMPIPERQAVAAGDSHNRKADDEVIRVADNLLLYQRNSGGWPKNIDMARVLVESEKDKLRLLKTRTDSTLDNGATHTQMRQLAKTYNATKIERFKDAFLQAVDYLLAAQYPNGGWPQFYPLRGGYSDHITFNDGAMIGAMSVLRDIAEKPEFAFVDQARRNKADEAVRRGIQCILKCQIVVDGKRTAWCAQHDQKTLEPRPARSYEKVSISGNESVGVVRFLMSIENPSPEVVESVEGAVAWFKRAKVKGIRQDRRTDSNAPRGFDLVVVKDSDAPPMWARFYEIPTNRPIFCSRDGIIRYRLAEISVERRTGYSWYGYYAKDLLAKDYPAWRKRLGAKQG
jgi:PelA/Pel-15E family pectate lyase